MTIHVRRIVARLGGTDVLTYLMPYEARMLGRRSTGRS